MMASDLNADDIARITAQVMEKLNSQKIDSDTLTRAVEEAAQREAPDAPPAAGPPPVAPALKTEAEEATAAGRKRIIIASFGMNRPGIVAAISAILAENVCSIEDMSQRIMQEFYTLIMIVDISACKADFAELTEKLHAVEERLGVTILAQHEDMFRYMHRV
jgi:ACT domain-containing protein